MAAFSVKLVGWAFPTPTLALQRLKRASILKEVVPLRKKYYPLLHRITSENIEEYYIIIENLVNSMISNHAIINPQPSKTNIQELLEDFNYELSELEDVIPSRMNLLTELENLLIWISQNEKDISSDNESVVVGDSDPIIVNHNQLDKEYLDNVNVIYWKSDKLIGNKNTKIYHFEQKCQFPAWLVSDNVVIFLNHEDAYEQGYRKCKNCKKIEEAQERNNSVK